MTTKDLLQNIIAGDFKTLSRAISKIENDNCDDLLKLLPSSNKKILGITGPPGAGKSTLVNCLISEYIQQGKKIGVLCIDPSSAFTHGALLGDRIRMNKWFNHPDVYIRSLASRGNMSGLHPFIIEITDVMKAAPFDKIIIETVGVGQTETEIAALADTTVVVLVPEAGDEIQTMKAGLMEIADVFVVNKSDRPGVDKFVKDLSAMLAPAFQLKQKEIPVIKTIATENIGINELIEKIDLVENAYDANKKIELLAEKMFKLIQQKRMRDINKDILIADLTEAYKNPGFNLYKLAEKY
ncbi:MAG TPA: methylmalonyl Co-A mutase-associated GTPase MeaB [Parafilimonas sp.]|nr:methylmalonyl Co-A mutase-associated GTPase MeaB [Parafilimonas sp.]